MLPDGDFNYSKEAISVFGTTVTVNLITYTATSPITETLTETQTKPNQWVGVGVAPALTLIHNAADATSAGVQSTTSSAASPSRAIGENAIGFILTCWAAGLAVGILCTSLL